MEEMIQPITDFLKNPLSDPFVLSVGLTVALAVFKPIVRLFVEKYSKVILKCSEKFFGEGLTTGVLKVIWHSSWAVLILTGGLIILITSFRTFDEFTKANNSLSKSIILSVTVAAHLLISQELLYGLLRDYTSFLKGSNEKLLRRIWRGIWVAIILLFGTIGLSGSLETFGVSAGVITALVAASFRTPLTGIVVWLILTAREPFSKGSYIEIGDIKGEVESMDLMHITLKETDIDNTNSSKFLIPNATLFNQAITIRPILLPGDD